MLTEPAGGQETWPGRLRLDDRITLQRLETLCLAVELGSVSRVAERLGIPDGVVSAQLRQFGDRCGVPLLDQRSSGVRLTEEGQYVYRWAAEVLAQGRAMIRELENLAAGAEAGAVIIGASMSLGTYLLPRVLTSLRRLRPQAELTLTVGHPEETLRGVVRGELDFGVVMTNALPDGSTLVAELLGDDELVLVTAPDGIPGDEEIDVCALASLPVIGPPRGSVRRQLVDSLLAAHGARIAGSGLEVGHPEAAKRMALDGLGPTLISRCAVRKDLARGALRVVRISDISLRFHVYAVRRTDQRLSGLHLMLLDMIRADLRDHDSQPGKGDSG